ncbi:MAG TPA: ABC transporter permease [Ilumatobacteraceae bacterium]|nr:ABC transporter permease [Ilumatobacteraceae bacterium]
MTSPTTITARLRDAGIRVAAIAAAIAVWYVLTARADSLFFPTPDKVFTAVWDDWIRPYSTTWSENLRPSLTRLLAGYLIAAALAIAAGIMIGRSRRLGDYVEPVIDFVRAIPPPALLPLFLVLLGIGDSMKIALIATGVFPPILLNSIDGVRSIDPLYLDTANVFRISRLHRVTHVILPSAAPKIFAGLRISLSIAVILMVISELIAATNGVGFRILQSQRQFLMVDLWAGLVVLGVIGAGLNAGLSVIERRVLRWERR